MKPTITYKGFDIVFEESNDELWVCRELLFAGHKVADVRSAIHKHLKASSKFKRMPVLYRDRAGRDYVLAEITSVSEKGDAWLTINGERKKGDRYSSDYRSAENNDQAEEIIRLQREKARIEKEISDLLSTMEKIEPARYYDEDSGNDQ